MKRAIVLLLLILMISPVIAALPLTFQNAGDFSSHVTCTGTGVGGSCSWTDNSNTCGNSYIYINSGVNGATYYIINADPEATTYAAATLIAGTWNSGFGRGSIRLYDSTGVSLAELNLGNTVTPGARYEVIVSGGTATVYKNGVSVTSSAVASNPYYVGFGAASESVAGSGNSYWDDYVYGASNKYIFSAPTSGCYIRNDLVNPAASGLYNPSGTLVSSTNMTTTWAKGATTAETVNLMNFGTNVVVGSFGTGSAYAGTKSWPIQDDVINNALATYGYYVTTISGSARYSDVIPYRIGGASVTFDKDTYSRNDEASMTWTIDAAYWDTATYSYNLVLYDVYLNVVDTQTITTQTGAKTYTFTDTDTIGVYYAVVQRTQGTTTQWMVIDTAELIGHLVFTGWANDGQNNTYLNGANISIVQGTTYYNKVTSVDGNYTTDAAFYSGAVTTINATKTGYRQYLDTFTPLAAKNISLNITLEPLNPIHTGISIQGIDRDTIYGRPIPSASIVIYNTTYGENYTVTTNNVGYYLLDESDGVILTNARLYFGKAVKSGYGESATYPIAAVGV